jgi:hypothetical protein
MCDGVFWVCVASIAIVVALGFGLGAWAVYLTREI